MLEDFKAYELSIKGASDKEEKDFFIDLLKDDIKEADGKVDAETQKLIDKLKEMYLGAEKTPSPKVEKRGKVTNEMVEIVDSINKKGKKSTPKTTKKPRAKTTPEQKAKNREKVQNATGKTIEECKEILAKYEALRGKTTQKDKQRVEKLKDEDKIIDGTNVKTADAITETTAKQVPKKIKQEVDAIEKEAEKEAKEEVNPKGKTKAEVKKEVEEVKIEKIEEKVKDMTKDLADKSSELIKAMSKTISDLSPSKDEVRKFLLDIRGQVDVLLKAYKFGGAVQSYNVPWMGGQPMPSYAKGGKVEFETKLIKGYADELKDYTHFAIHKPTNSIAGNWDYKEYDRDELMENKEDYFFIDLKDDHEGNVDKFKKSDFAIITRSGLKNKGIDLNNYNVFYGQKYSKGGKFADGGRYSILGVSKSSLNEKPTLHSSVNNRSEIKKAVAEAKKDFKELTNQEHDIFVADNEEDRQIYNYSKGGSTYGGDGEEYIYPSEEERIDEMAKHWNSEGWASSSVSKQGDDGEFFDKIGVDSDEVGITSQTGNDIIYYDVNRPSYFNRDFAKGGRTTRAINQDRARLSKEKHEQAYKSKRKGSYRSFEMGGKTMIDEEFSNVPEELEEVFGMYNEDEETYSEMKRLKGIANQRGYDFDYGLDGEPTEFWEINKMARGGKTWVQDVVDSPNFREGAFTRKAEARGMSTDAFMNQVLHSPNLYDERTRKQAQFMKNAFND